MTILGKKQMSEEDIKLNYITPVILDGWKGHVTMETKITDGRINISGNIVARSNKNVKNQDHMKRKVIKYSEVNPMPKTIAVISDTHDLLQPEVIDRIDGSDGIVHAGDIDKPEIVEQLKSIAPLYVVRGNNDME